MVHTVFRHRTEEEAGHLTSAAGSDDQQCRTPADFDERIPRWAVSNFTFAHNLGLDLLDLCQGFVHDRPGSHLVWARGHNGPGHHVRDLLVGAHDLEQRTAQRRFVSCKRKSSRATFRAVDAHHDPEFACVLR